MSEVKKMPAKQVLRPCGWCGAGKRQGQSPLMVEALPPASLDGRA